MRNGTEIKIELTLIRHGETPSNLEHRYLGRTEENLSADGIKQMQCRKDQLTQAPLDLLFVSPMTRCKESANILYEGQTQIEIPEWKEMDFGQYEGKNYQDLKDDPYYQQWIDSNGTLPFPNGECQAEFVARCQTGWERAYEMILNEQREKGNLKTVIHAAAVVHGGTIMAVMSFLTGGSYFDYQTRNGCGFHLRMNLPVTSCKSEYEMEVLN